MINTRSNSASLKNPTSPPFGKPITTQISNLEGELALSKSREDNLREEVAEFPRREAALCKLHSETLKEVGRWTQMLEYW